MALRARWTALPNRSAFPLTLRYGGAGVGGGVVACVVLRGAGAACLLRPVPRDRELAPPPIPPPCWQAKYQDTCHAVRIDDHMEFIDFVSVRAF